MKKIKTVILAFIIILGALGTSLLFQSDGNMMLSSVISPLSDTDQPPTTVSFQNTCLLCVHGYNNPKKDDIALKQSCDKAVLRARDAHYKRAISLSSNEYAKMLLDGTENLCGCQYLEAIYERHGSPGDEDRTFQDTKGLVKIASSCSTINVNDTRCSGFNDANKALEYAKNLQTQLLQSGYQGTISITGAQTINFVSRGDAGSQYIYGKNSFGRRMLSFTSGLIGYRKLVVLPKVIPPLGANYCSRNTPLGFQVCAKDVKLILFPCKNPGSESALDRDSGANTTILCENNHVKANQKCVYRSNKKEGTGCMRNDGTMVEFSAKCPYFQCVWGDPEDVSCKK